MSGHTACGQYVQEMGLHNKLGNGHIKFNITKVIIIPVSVKKTTFIKLAFDFKSLKWSIGYM